MKFFDYLESRFVTSQLEVNQKKSTRGHAENQAILALMWVWLKCSTANHIVAVLTRYCAIRLGMRPTPSTAREIATQAQVAASQAKIQAERIAQDVIAQANKPQLHEVKGNA